MKIYRSYFAKKFREALDSSGLTQTSLAEKIGVEPPTISRWYNGKDFPSDEKLPSIIKALNLSSAYFDVNSQSKLLSLKDVADFLSRLEALRPDLRALVLAVVYGDPELYLDLPDDISQALAKVLVKPAKINKR